VLKIRAEYGDNEKKMWIDGREQAAEMLEAAGAKAVRMTGQHSVPGLLHPRGWDCADGERQADQRSESLQPGARGAEYFRDDGACWVSSGCQNPTLTMMAITVRACDYITKEYAKQIA
jgi:hypothetical protein